MSFKSNNWWKQTSKRNTYHLHEATYCQVRDWFPINALLFISAWHPQTSCCPHRLRVLGWMVVIRGWIPILSKVHHTNKIDFILSSSMQIKCICTYRFVNNCNIWQTGNINCKLFKCFLNPIEKIVRQSRKRLKLSPRQIASEYTKTELGLFELL